MANNAAQDEFVDLYAVLEVPEDADTEQIRKRVNVLYIEAQQNLDHRNVKKKLQFQQMYEIYLPQARHLLLDTRRRAEYDRYLQAYRTGSKVAPTDEATTPASESTLGDLGGAPGKVSDHDLPEIVEQEIDPEQLAAERESMWAKWKTGLEAISESSDEAAPAGGAPAMSATLQADAVAPSRPMPPASAAPRPSGARPPVTPRTGAARTPRPAPRAGGPAPSPFGDRNTGQQAPAQTNEVEKQREQQRFQLIKDAVQTAGMMWGAGIGAIVFVVGCVILFTLDNSLKQPPFNLSRTTFALIGFCVVLIATAIGFAIARKKAKRRAVAELSVMTLEDLMRRSR